jgi:hypothetical protein
MVQFSVRRPANLVGCLPELQAKIHVIIGNSKAFFIHAADGQILFTVYSKAGASHSGDLANQQQIILLPFFRSISE